MKPEITPQVCLENLARFIIGAYESSPTKESGTIQLNLKHVNEIIACHFSADGQTMIFSFDEVEIYDVKLTAELYDWLDLAAQRLNPVWGAILGKLKFEGDPKVFGNLIKHDLLYKINTDIADPPTAFEINPLKKWKQPQKILVINGSPRGRNGYTFHYLNRFIKGLQIAGASVETIELAQKKLNPCIGCFHCWINNTGRCVQNDDLNDLHAIYEDSDLIIYAFTLYWDTVPGILKNFIERTFCLEHPYMIPGIYKTRHPRRTKNEKAFFVFSVCGFPEQSHFDSVQDYFKKISHNSHVPYTGGIYRSACMLLPNDPTYYKTYNQILEALHKAGESFYKNGKIDHKTLKTVQTKINPKVFREHANKFWDNVVLKDDYCVKKV